MTREEALQYSPMLAGKLAAPTNEGVETVAKKIFEAVRQRRVRENIRHRRMIATPLSEL